MCVGGQGVGVGNCGVVVEVVVVGTVDVVVMGVVGMCGGACSE